LDVDESKNRTVNQKNNLFLANAKNQGMNPSWPSASPVFLSDLSKQPYKDYQTRLNDNRLSRLPDSVKSLIQRKNPALRRDSLARDIVFRTVSDESRHDFFAPALQPAGDPQTFRHRNVLAKNNLNARSRNKRQNPFDRQ
jgi:hypothetical protein